jgi:glycosyltransferase involved in cell wall biosynthesis/multidrug transporter EmrE-like cation transporter
VNILVVAPYPPQRDGIGIYAKAQSDRLRSDGHAVAVLSPPGGSGEARVPFWGGRPFFRAARMGGVFDRIVVHFQPSVYFRPRRPISKILTGLGLGWLALRWGPRLEIVVHEADPMVAWRPDYLLLRAAFRRAGTLSFHTRAEWVMLERSYRVRVRGRVVPHLAAPAGASSKEEARRRLGLPERDTVFVCAGFLQPSKGFDRALDAFSRANGTGRLYIVGSVRIPTPENEAYAGRLAATCGTVPGAALVRGFVSDQVFDLWLTAADWVVLPYRRSWSSGVLARAHALGTPAIVTAVGGLAEQAREKDVVVQDDEELVRAFRRTAGAEGPNPEPAAAVSSEPPSAGSNAAPDGPAGGAAPDGPARGRSHVHGGPVDSDWDPELEAISTKEGKAVLIGLILISVALAALAQLTLKHGMNQVTGHGELPLELSEPVETIRRILLNASVWGGLLIFVASASVWLIVLSRTSLSFAYPFAALTYVLILLFDRLVLHEPISGLRYGGVALIIAGLVLISRTHQTT